MTDVEQGQRIRELREAHNLSQADLALKVWKDHKRRSYLSAIEAGKHSITRALLTRILEAIHSTEKVQGIVPITPLEPTSSSTPTGDPT